MCMRLQTGGDNDTAENPDDFLLSYNVNGIRMSEAAFRQLGQEISSGAVPHARCRSSGAAKNSGCMPRWFHWAEIFFARSWCAPAGWRKLMRANSA